MAHNFCYKLASKPSTILEAIMPANHNVANNQWVRFLTMQRSFARGVVLMAPYSSSTTATNQNSPFP